MKRIITILFIFYYSTQGVANAQVSVSSLTCEWLQNPLGIDITHPRLAWQISSSERNIQQSAYQILVASSADKLDHGEYDLWNSGKVTSAETINVHYMGKALVSRTACYWKVKIFTNKGSAESDPNHWTIGLLNKSDWKAKWIGYDKSSPWDSITTWSRLSARYLRKDFNASSQVRKATVYVSGLGLYQLFINVAPIVQDELVPAPTDYRKTVLYNTYDVTGYIRQGGNAIGIVLGNGRFFTMRQNYKPQKINTFGYPKLLLQLEIEYANGKKEIITSDNSWKLNVDGPIRSNNDYDGEEFDLRKSLGAFDVYGYDDKAWNRAELVNVPPGILRAQAQPPMKIMRVIKPVALKEIDGKYILDMGQNFAGWCQIKVRGKSGDQIKLRFAESLDPSGNLYTANLRDAKCTDIYTCRGDEVEWWHPSFVTHGFRYIEISGYKYKPGLDDFEGHLIYDDLETTGTFSCSDSTINKIYQNAWWGIASDYKGMPVDCPQRNERQPWLGDRAQGAYGESFLFNNVALYSKWLNDIEESQTPQGAIPDVAPAFWNYYSDDVTWPGTYLLVAEMLYRQFGDVDDIKKHYPSMKKWMNYMKDKYMKNDLITKDKYGDWCVPPESLELIRSKDSLRNTNGELIATAYYYHFLQLLQEFAQLSDHTQDIPVYKSLAIRLRTAFNKRFYNPARHYYDNNTVTANILPLWFGIASDSLSPTIMSKIYEKTVDENKMHISTGVIGTQWLLRSFTKYSSSSVAYALASNKTYPSWGYMAENGATTIWELWNGNTANPQMNSQNHVMLLGDLLIWLYEDLAGIKSDPKETGFKKIIMNPCFNAGPSEVNASYHSIQGPIKSNWKIQGNTITWNITIPANSHALIYLPAGSPDDIKEGNKPAAKSEGVRFLKTAYGTATIELGSGTYTFTSNSTYQQPEGSNTNQ